MSDNPQEKKESTKKSNNTKKDSNEQKKVETNENNDLYENKNSSSRTETLDNLDIGKILKEQEENDMKFNFKNIEEGKQYFKERYIKEKLEEISNKIKRMSYSKDLDKEMKNQQQRLSLQNQNLINKTSFDNYEKETERRKCETEFLLIVEKSIISFNLKKYQESYTYLENSGVITNLNEFGKFLLVVSGFDKGILGEFLAKEKPPNENKDILNSFITSIDLNYKNNSFLECLRFLLTRIILPKDANMILVIMDKFSEKFFVCNKKDEKFVSIFCNINAIYLLVSTILALNTMFTRKDIKNMNIIKKDEFKKMNKDINASYLDDLYEELKKKPISLSDDYSEEIYKKLAPLVLVKNKDMNTKNLDSLSKEKEKKDEEEDDENDNININKIVKSKNVEQQYYEFVQEFMDLDIVRTTLRGNYNRKKSYSMNTNLLYFNQHDKDLLSKPNKFYRISGSSNPALREFIVFDNFKKLALEKAIEPNQTKFKKFLDINDINDVYIGQGHGDNIKKYIKAYPEEEKLVNNFISIVYNNHKDQLDIKSDNLSLALQWFKAMKSLVIQTKMKEEETKVKKEREKQNELREKLTSIWDEYILLNLDYYMGYIIIKCYEKFNLFHGILPQPEKISKLDLFDEKKILNVKTIEDFLNEVNERFERNYKNKLEYQEFFSLCYLGFPHKYRKKMWKIFIGNDLSITKKMYIFYQKDLMKNVYDFGDMDLKLRENANVQFSDDFNLNLILIDIIKSRYIFLQAINEQNLDDDELLQKIYNITYVFNLIRSDIPYNKGIVLLAYLFLLVGYSEVKSFKCIMNLICSRNIVKFYTGDTDTINRYINFFTKLLEKYAKNVYDHLNKLEIKPELYLIPWFEKLFIQSLDYDILLHVFDLYIINGEYILFQTAITIIKLLEEDILNLTISEVFKLLKRLPKKYTDLEFFEKFKNYNCIYEEYVKWNKGCLLKEQQKIIKE